MMSCVWVMSVCDVKFGYSSVELLLLLVENGRL